MVSFNLYLLNHCEVVMSFSTKHLFEQGQDSGHQKQAAGWLMDNSIVDEIYWSYPQADSQDFSRVEHCKLPKYIDTI